MQLCFLLGGLFWRLQENIGGFVGLNQNIAVIGVAAYSSYRFSCPHIYAFIVTSCNYLTDLMLGALWVMMYALLYLN
jgi:hypothetical protein